MAQKLEDTFLLPYEKDVTFYIQLKFVIFEKENVGLALKTLKNPTKPKPRKSRKNQYYNKMNAKSLFLLSQFYEKVL